MNGREKMRVINWLADMGEVGSVSVSDLPSKLTMKYFIHRPEPSCFVFVDNKYFFSIQKRENAQMSVIT